MTAKKRVFDEVVIARLIKDLYPDEDEGQTESMFEQLLQTGKREKKYTALVCSEETVQIQKTLQHFCGNREKSAEALGISKVTLWRRMKKYGIEV